MRLRAHDAGRNLRRVEVMAILDAGIRSAASGKLELVDEATWHTGEHRPMLKTPTFNPA